MEVFVLEEAAELVGKTDTVLVIMVGLTDPEAPVPVAPATPDVEFPNG